LNDLLGQGVNIVDFMMDVIEIRKRIRYYRLRLDCGPSADLVRGHVTFDMAVTGITINDWTIEFDARIANFLFGYDNLRP
jgi:hypothetical protein